MYLEISNPMDYHAALYIRLSKEDESEGGILGFIRLCSGRWVRVVTRADAVQEA